MAGAKEKKKNPLPVTSQVLIHHPQMPGTGGPSPPAPSLGRSFQPPRPRACGTGGRLMGQVLVPRAGPCPDKAGAEIVLGQYSAVATWSCGWSHLRGSREERTQGVLPPARPSCVPWETPLPYPATAPCAVPAGTPRSRTDPRPPPAICSPCPLPPIGFHHAARLPGQSQGFSLPRR